MKILKPGKYTENWAIEHLCTGYGNGGNGCGALLEIERNDLRHYPPINRGTWGDRDEAVLFKCPICEKLTDLAFQDWPTTHQTLKKFSTSWKDGTESDML